MDILFPYHVWPSVAAHGISLVPEMAIPSAIPDLQSGRCHARRQINPLTTAKVNS